MDNKLEQDLNHEIAQAFAVVLKQLRAKTGLGQEELAFKSGLHRTYISQMERGLKSPSLTTIYKLSMVLGISMEQMMALVEKEVVNVPT
jgi:transcriptional regulator with XRE-family HTH domain